MKYISAFEKFTQDTTPTNEIYILIGPPGVGKSTWVKNNLLDRNPYIISRDDIVEKVAGDMGLLYDDMFSVPSDNYSLGDIHPKYGHFVQAQGENSGWSNIIDGNHRINFILHQRTTQAQTQKCIVVDMTNLTRKTRKWILGKILNHLDNPDSYKKIAVEFDFTGKEELLKDDIKKRELEYKKLGKSKTISDRVLSRMIGQWQPVTLDEGFDYVIQVPHYSQNSNKFTN